MPRIRLSDACYDAVLKAKHPLVTRYDINLLVHKIAKAGNYQGKNVYSLRETPIPKDISRVITQLTDEHKLSNDKDFSSGIFLVHHLPDVNAEDACCLVDRYCYVSHLSAMQHHGITDRIPDQLNITRPEPRIWAQLAEKSVAEDYTELDGFSRGIRIRRYTIGSKIRGRKVHTHDTKYPGKTVLIRNTFTRLSKIEQTFCDMLEKPELCGGMNHVIEVWQMEAKTYLERIVDLIDLSESKIVKVRAGYIITELLGIENRIVENWQRFASRGGSRKLDPTREYKPVFSEKWMISLNADI